MMEYYFVVDGLEPKSVNSAYTLHGHKKLKTIIKWENRLYSSLMLYHRKARDIKELFEPTEHVLTVDYILFYPSKIFWTKKGHISLRKMDWSNLPKLLDDIVFNRFIGIDDKSCQSGSLEQVPWDRDYFSMVVIIKIKTHREILERSSRWEVINNLYKG